MVWKAVLAFVIALILVVGGFWSLFGPELSFGKERVVKHVAVEGGPRLSVSLEAPSAWRTVFLPPADRFGEGNRTLVVFGFVPDPKDPLKKDSALVAENQFSFYDLTAWAEEDSEGATAAEKQAFFKSLADMRGSEDPATAVCDPVAAYVPCLKGANRAVYVESADGKLSGYAFPIFARQGYDLDAFVVMAGAVEGRIVYAEGFFNIYDRNSGKAEELLRRYQGEANRERLAEEMEKLAAPARKKLPGDAEEAFERAVRAAESVRVGAL